MPSQPNEVLCAEPGLSQHVFGLATPQGRRFLQALSQHVWALQHHGAVGVCMFSQRFCGPAPPHICGCLHGPSKLFLSVVVLFLVLFGLATPQQTCQNLRASQRSFGLATSQRRARLSALLQGLVSLQKSAGFTYTQIMA